MEHVWTEYRDGLMLYVCDSENNYGPRYFGGYRPDNPKEFNLPKNYGRFLQTATRFKTAAEAIAYVIACADRLKARRTTKD